MAYSHVLQRVGKVAHGRKWKSRRESLEIKASPLVYAFWHETDMDLTMASVKLCWEPAPRALYHQRENGPTAHVISYLNELAVRVPTLEAWDQMVWPTTVAISCVLTEAKSLGYCWGQAVDLSPVMPAAQFCITEEGGTYLCTMRALVFEGSILAYNPTLNEAIWVPVCGLANNLSWAEERSAVALANYVLHASVEVAWITRLGAGQVMSCPDDDSSTISMEGEELQHSDAPSTNLPTDTDHEVGEESKEPIGSEEGADRQMSPGDEAETNACTNQCHCPQNWEVVMEESEGLAYNDPHSSSNATIVGADSLPGPQLSSRDESANSPPNTLRGLAPHSPGSPMEQMLLLVPTVAMLASGMDTVEVHVPQAELDVL